MLPEGLQVLRRILDSVRSLDVLLGTLKDALCEVLRVGHVESRHKGGPGEATLFPKPSYTLPNSSLRAMESVCMQTEAEYAFLSQGVSCRRVVDQLAKRQHAYGYGPASEPSPSVFRLRIRALRLDPVSVPWWHRGTKGVSHYCDFTRPNAHV